jgi:pimeloyl-ACP methyl ester carboxylesterase/putative sterol carrier protein
MVLKTSGAPAESPEAVARRVRTLPRRFLADTVNGLTAEWELRIDDRPFTVSVAAGRCEVREGPALSPATVIATDGATWLAMDEGSTQGAEAFLDRRLSVRGNLDLAVRLQTLFRPFRRRSRPTDLHVVDVYADGVRISCYEVGRGEPILLLHGLGGSKISWLPLLTALGAEHRLLVPDFPGHGDSEKPKGADFTPRYYAHVMRVLMDATGMDRAIVLGNSMGGRVALEMALRSPRRVRALALLDPAVPGLRWRYMVGFTRIVPTEFGSMPLPMRRRWMELAVRRLFADATRLPPDAVHAAADEFLRIYADPAARMAFFASLRHIVSERPGPFFASMRRVRQPTLVLFGDQDRLVPPRLGAELASHLPDAELHFLPDVGHVPQFEATEQTLDLLLPFLDRVAGR